MTLAIDVIIGYDISNNVCHKMPVKSDAILTAHFIEVLHGIVELHKGLHSNIRFCS